jgi:8-oxo-dGTP diphosphatase
MPYTPILATLAYIVSSDGEETLLIHRNNRPGDHHLGKYNGLGGKLEADEDIIAGLRREIREEAGLEIDEIQLRGTISWPGFGKHGEDWFGFIFRIDRFSGDPHPKNEEGSLAWVPVSRLLKLELPLWEGDRYFLPLVFGDDSHQFHGVMPYKNGHPTGWSYSLIDP